MPPTKDTMSEFEQVELEWKRLQIEEMRSKMQMRAEERERLEQLRSKQLRDFNKAQEQREGRQRVCKHRKGGRNNQFANGNDANYSVIRNTYPTGIVAIMCTRCFKEVVRPDPRDRKKDPKAYAERLAVWREWDAFPTDNSPSGGKIFEIIPAAA